MSDLERLVSWFDDRRLVRPRSSGIRTTVDLINTLVGLCNGAASPASWFERAIEPAEHYLFVIIDGLGDALLHDMCPDGYLAKRLYGQLEAVFPSTTGAAMTSYATGAYPAEHGVPGWWVYLEEHDVSGISLLFKERFAGTDLRSLGLPPAAMYGTTPALLSMMRRDAAVVTPFPGTVYSTYSSGGCPHIGYGSIADAFDQAAARVTAAREPTYTQLYLPQLDGLCHEVGVTDGRCRELLREIDAHVERLCAAIQGAARVVISADHGHVNLPPDRRVMLRADDPLMAYLRCPPTGEPTVPMFHVRPGQERPFAEAFRRRFREWFALISIDEADDLRLFGPGPMTSFARRRTGQFIAIAPEPTTINFIGPNGPESDHRGVHAGLTSGEMRVPLVVV